MDEKFFLDSTGRIVSIPQAKIKIFIRRVTMKESVLKSHLAILLIRKYFTQSLPDKKDGSTLSPNYY